MMSSWCSDAGEARAAAAWKRLGTACSQLPQ
jgi:hypothetical protein